jgi:hypothetical protein
MEGVVSVHSFETLLQYLVLGKIVQQGEAKPEEIGHIIEFMRLADMCGVVGVEEVMSARLKDIIMKNSVYYHSTGWGTQRGQEDVEIPPIVTIKHISAAANIPPGNLIRRVFVEAAVHDFFQCTKVQFWKKTCQEIPSFGLDLLEAARDTMGTVHGYKECYFKDPIDHGTAQSGVHECTTSWGCDSCRENNTWR